MEVKLKKRMTTSLLFIISICLSFFTVNAYSQTMELVVTGPNTFQIKVYNVYSWNVDENVNGTWVENVLTGGSSGTPGTTFTRKGGAYYFRLRNCYNVANGCSTSSSKSVHLPGSAPAAPTISAGSSYTSINVSWSQSTGASGYLLFRNGTQIGFSGTFYKDTSVVGGVTYTYSVRACNTWYECSANASVSASLAIDPTTQSKSLTYTYDELGRLTFVADPVNGNRDYDYDSAGNRVRVSTNTPNDSHVEPGVTILPAPTNLYYSQIYSCAWRATWSLVSGAAKYRVADTSGAVQFVSTNEAVVQCPVGNASGNKPRKVQACTVNNVCGTEAFFN